MDNGIPNIMDKPILPKTFDEKYDFLRRVFGHTDEANNIINFMIEGEFLQAPASTVYHGNYDGGLFEHCFYVGWTLQMYTELLGLEWENPRSPWLVGMLHDLCKIDSYKKVITYWDEDGGNKDHAWEKSTDCIIKGHGEKSLIYALQHIRLTEEEIACIRYHMGAYNTNEWEYYDRAIKKYPNVLYTHTADMHASKVYGV